MVQHCGKSDQGTFLIKGKTRLPVSLNSHAKKTECKDGSLLILVIEAVRGGSEAKEVA